MPGEIVERHGLGRRADADRAASSGLEFSIASAPATARHRQLAAAVVVAALLAYLAIIPYAHIRLPRIDSFVPTVFAISIIGDLLIAVLLFGQFRATGFRSLLVLGSGHLFAAIVRAGYVLAFPGAFTPEGLLGAGPQTSAWLGVLSRIGLAVSISLYAILTMRTRRRGEVAAGSSAIWWSLAITVIAACALIFAATAGHDLWPPLLSSDTVLPLGTIVNAAFTATNVVALVLLASTRSKSILDLWLMVAVLATLIESAMIVLLFHERFSFAFYAIRLISLPVSKVVLIVLLWETMRLYTNLAIANRELQRERANRLINAAAGLAAIAHEIRQPLAGINMTAFAGQKMLKKSPPDVAAAEEIFGQIATASQRAGDVFTGILALFRQGEGRVQALDVNAAVVEATELVHEHLGENDVAMSMHLAEDLPLVCASEVQLRAVILSIIQNSVEAMTGTGDEPRTIRIATSLLGSGAVSISFEDTRTRIGAEDLETQFDPFISTNAPGGLGLAICRMVIEQHGGELSARFGDDGGVRFEITLPRA